MNLKTHELPVHINNIECVTECWTFNRLAILKTMPYYEDWIASHYDLHTTSSYNFSFGQMQMYAPSYYDIVLERKPIGLFDLSENTVVNRLREELLNGYYLIMHVKTYDNIENYHEVLIYGFDDIKEVFCCVGPGNPSFKKIEYGYRYIESTLESVKKEIVDKRRGETLSLYFQYPLSAFKPRQNYNKENCVFEAYRKIKDEFFGGHSLSFDMVGFGEYGQSRSLYRGIHCLVAAEEMLKKIIADEDMKDGFRGIVNAFRKLYEHRCMMIISMRYVLRNWTKAINPCNPCIENSVLVYEECCKVVQKWEILAIKYELTFKKDILNRILDEIPEIYEREHKCLDEFVNHCIDWDKFHKYYV